MASKLYMSHEDFLICLRCVHSDPLCKLRKIRESKGICLDRIDFGLFQVCLKTIMSHASLCTLKCCKDSTRQLAQMNQSLFGAIEAIKKKKIMQVLSVCLSHKV